MIAGAAADDEARWESGLEREGEGEEVPEDGVLTLSASGSSPEEGTVGGGRGHADVRRPEAETGTEASILGIPASIPWPGMKRTARRISWWRRRGPGQSEEMASSTAMRQWRRRRPRHRARVRVAREGEQGKVREGQGSSTESWSLSAQGGSGIEAQDGGHGGMARQWRHCRPQ